MGVTFSFLIAAPMINEVALVLLIGLFGWKVALIYVLTGLGIAILAGFILEKLNLKKYVADWVYETHAKQTLEQENSLTLNQRISAGGEVVREIVGKIWIYILIGIAVGAGAHGFVPDEYEKDIRIRKILFYPFYNFLFEHASQKRLFTQGYNIMESKIPEI